MSEKLKPCPFCGGEAEILQTSGHMFCPLCSDCDTSGGHYFTEEDAACAWNDRAERTCHRVMRGLKNAPGFVGGFCSECEHPINEGAAYCEHCGARVVRGDE